MPETSILPAVSSSTFHDGRPYRASEGQTALVAAIKDQMAPSHVFGYRCTTHLNGHGTNVRVIRGVRLTEFRNADRHELSLMNADGAK